MGGENIWDSLESPKWALGPKTNWRKWRGEIGNPFTFPWKAPSKSPLLSRNLLNLHLSAGHLGRPNHITSRGLTLSAFHLPLHTRASCLDVLNLTAPAKDKCKGRSHSVLTPYFCFFCITYFKMSILIILISKGRHFYCGYNFIVALFFPTKANLLFRGLQQATSTMARVKFWSCGRASRNGRL